MTYRVHSYGITQVPASQYCLAVHHCKMPKLHGSFDQHKTPPNEPAASPRCAGPVSVLTTLSSTKSRRHEFVLFLQLPALDDSLTIGRRNIRSPRRTSLGAAGSHVQQPPGGAGRKLDLLASRFVNERGLTERWTYEEELRSTAGACSQFLPHCVQLVECRGMWTHWPRQSRCQCMVAQQSLSSIEWGHSVL